jgi:ABC-type multidrug transport system fused ATPase/permease subunit
MPDHEPTGSPVDPVDLLFFATLRRLLRLWRREWRLVSIGLTCAFGVTFLSLAIPTLIQRAIDNAIVPDKPNQLPPYIAGIFILATARLVFNFTRRYSTARVGIRMEWRLRALLYDAYLRFPRAFYDEHATGQVVSRATNDLYPVRYFMGWGIVQSVQSLMMIIGVAIVLTYVNPELALLAGLAMPLVALLTYMFARTVIPISRRVQQKKADVTEASDEAVVGIEMVQAFGREDDVRSRFGDRAESVRDVAIKEAVVEARYIPGLIFIPTVSIATVLFFGGRQVIDHNLTLGQFVLFNTLLLQLVWPLEAFGWILNLAQRAIASAGRSFAWLEGVATLSEPEHPRTLPDGPVGVRFRGVRFGYATTREVLRGVDLEIEPGEIVAVCGGTGAGKTTLLNLLPRFYDPTEGTVEIGGVPTSDLALTDLRHAVAIVTQRPVLFSAPLRDNLVAARPDARWDEVEEACIAAGVADFVDYLPDGYDTLIGERGVNLSGGQRQRVALARALIAGARVIVLDDPLSAVDTQTERLLVEQLRPAVEGRTVLMAAQRLSTVEVADRAVVLEDGRIVEDGAPDELLRSDGAFEQLFGDEVAHA